VLTVAARRVRAGRSWRCAPAASHRPRPRGDESWRFRRGLIVTRPCAARSGSTNCETA